MKRFKIALVAAAIILAAACQPAPEPQDQQLFITPTQQPVYLLQAQSSRK